MTEKQTNNSNNEPELFNNAAKRVVESDLHISERGKNILKGTGVVAGVAAGTFIASQLFGGMAGGDDNPTRGELDPTLQSITVAEGANLRNDPLIPNRRDLPNLVEKLGEEVTLHPHDDIRVLKNTNNGTWYGIEKEDITAAIPNFNDESDKDGIIWVNEDGISSVEKANVEIADPYGPNPGIIAKNDN
ncbi:MAG: hypothetical protein ACOH18_01650 [Candidatus Saccharimonadaceae bacterium]